MFVINARNVNGALGAALWALNSGHEVEDTRNGPVLAFPTPVATVYQKPEERVLFSPLRNANPTFHLVESLWMLAGRKDVKFPATFVKNMRSFTDDGLSFWGAYGWRWRSFFGWDQLEGVIQELTENPQSRRVVLGMWDPVKDFRTGQAGGKDVPCNTQIYFAIRGGKLHMTVCCRSNDILWGAYGANAVHMSVLQEYVARAVGVPVGTYTQMSNNLHLYKNVIPSSGVVGLAIDAENNDLYDQGIRPSPLWSVFETREDFDHDLKVFFDAFDEGGHVACLEADYKTTFFRCTIVPMVQAWSFRKTKSLSDLYTITAAIEAQDWGLAMRQWLGTNHHSFGGQK